MNKISAKLLPLAALVALGGCGSESSDSTTPSTHTRNTAPVFESSLSFSMEEGTVTTGYIASASDANHDTLSFFLDGADKELFNLEPQTGVLTFKLAPDSSAPLDANGDNIYELVLIVSDGSAETRKNLTLTVVTAPTNTPPTFQTANTALITEGHSGTAFTATASDSDGDPVTYSLTGTDAHLFTIDSSSGEISFIIPPIFATPADDNTNNVYEFDIVASDGIDASSQGFRLSVEELNEAPEITSANSATLVEGLTDTSYTATATDANGDTIVFHLSGDDAALFTLDASSGVLSFKTAPSFNAPSDANGDNIYNLMLEASDGTVSSSLPLSVTVQPFVNILPMISSASTHTMYEGRTTTGYSLTATDGNDDSLTYSIESGADAALFSIDAATGALSFLSAPDFDTPRDSDLDNVYQVTLSVSDSHGAATQAISVTVNEFSEPVSGDIPTSFTVTHAGTCGAPVVLNWVDATNSAIGAYRVRRRPVGTSIYNNIGDVLPGVQTFTDNDPELVEDQDYQYVVRPLINGGAVGSSAVVDVNTYCDGIPPTDPDPIDPNDNGIRKTDSNYFQEENGLVIMEIESAPELASYLTKPDSWIMKTDVAGYRGTGHIEFTGNNIASGPAADPLTYKFKVQNGGLYRLMLRARKRLETEETDKSNDCYVKVKGNYGADPAAEDAHNKPALLEQLQVSKKLYGGPSSGWGWTENLDMGGTDNKRKPHYLFEAGETYELTVSGRSKNFNIDRIVFYKMDQYSTDTLDVSNPQLKQGTPETVTSTYIGEPSANRALNTGYCPEPPKVVPLWQNKGRIVISSDGNEHDKDDWAATPMSLAMLAAKGLQDKLALYTFSDHIWGSNQDESDGDAQMRESAIGAAERFGFDKSRFLEAVADPVAAINAMTAEINKSTAEDPLIIVGAGPMDVIGQALDAADKTKLQYVTTLSHSNWNNNHADKPINNETIQESHSGWTYDEIRNTFSADGLTVVQISDQNGGSDYDGMRANKAYFDWLVGTGNANMEWLLSRQIAAQKGEEYDPSDAGMIIYLLEGIEKTDPCHAKQLMDTLLP